MRKIKERLKIIFSKKTIIQFSIFIGILLVQMLLYKLLTGEFVLNGYVNESFTHLTNPQIYKVLFSTNKGLFIFCPILFVGFLSMLLFENKNKEFKTAQFLIFIAQTYIIASWWCWWLGYGYSERMYCDVLCIFALPLANFFSILCNIKKKHTVIFFSLILIIILFIYINMNFITGISLGFIEQNYAIAHQLKKCLLLENFSLIKLLLH